MTYIYIYIYIKRFSYHNKFIAQRLSKLPGAVGAGALVVVIGSSGILPGGEGAGALVVVVGTKSNYELNIL